MQQFFELEWNMLQAFCQHKLELRIAESLFGDEEVQQQSFNLHLMRVRQSICLCISSTLSC